MTKDKMKETVAGAIHTLTELAMNVFPGLDESSYFNEAMALLHSTQVQKQEVFATWVVSPLDLRGYDLLEDLHISIGWTNEAKGENDQLQGVSMNDDGASILIESISGSSDVQVTLVVPVNVAQYELDEGDTLWFSPIDINGAESSEWGLRDTQEK